MRQPTIPLHPGLQTNDLSLRISSKSKRIKNFDVLSLNSSQYLGSLILWDSGALLNTIVLIVYGIRFSAPSSQLRLITLDTG